METHIHKFNRFFTFLVCLFVLATPVYAHTFWLQANDSGANLFLGDSADDQRYEEESVKEAKGFRADGTPVELEWAYSHGLLQLEAPQANVIWTKADYGYWRKTVRGWEEGTKEASGRTITSAWHIQYSKLVKEYSRPTKLDLELEIVIDSIDGKTMTGIVYLRGEPSPKIPLYIGHKKIARTNKSGQFKFSAPKGSFVLSAIHKEDIEHPKVDQRIVTSSYTLRVR